MKIYTKTGDKGQTSLLGGARVPKHSLRIESYGTIDELNSWIGLVRDQQIPADLTPILLEIQDRLFTMGSELATEPGKTKVKIPHLQQEDVIFLEKEIDRMEADLPPMRNFILPGGHPAVSTCHITRCVCRRAERLCVHLSSESEVDEIIPMYLNRLSDYLFVLSRWLSKSLNAEEIPWKARK